MRISVIGTGHVGLVTGVCLAHLGHHVSGVDVVAERVAAINSGVLPLFEPGLGELLAHGLEDGSFRATVDLQQAVASSDVTIIAVGTPLNGDGDIDLTYVRVAAEQVGLALRGTTAYHVVAVKSTVVPGTTDAVVRSALERSSELEAGQFGLCMNPEFLQEGLAVSDFLDADRIVIGQWDDRSGQVLARIYESFDCPKLFTTLRNAEMIKYAANSLLATLISFSNEIAALCETTPGTDIEMVMEGLHLDRRLTPRVAGQRFRPRILSYLRAGCGFGGSCLPKDLAALRSYARARGVRSHLLDAVQAINSDRPAQIVALAETALGGLAGATLTVLGLAFKPGTDDMRSSPALPVIDLLLRGGASVRAYDALALRAAKAVVDPRVELCDSPERALAGVDAALLVTAWPEFGTWNWQELTRQMKRPVIIDGRNALRAIEFPPGTAYFGIGVGREENRA